MPGEADRTFARFVRTYYGFHFCQSLCPVYAVYAIMFLDKGLSLREVSGLIVVWTATVVLLELPSGAVADRIHRGRLLAISNLAKALGFGCWLLPPSFMTYALGFMLWSVSGSLRSGTLQSLLYDTLRTHDRTAQYEHIAGRGLFIGRVAQGVAFVAGGPLAFIDYSWAVWASIVPLLIGSLLALAFSEVREPHEMTKTASLFDHVRVAADTARRNYPIRRIVLYSMCAVATVGTLEEFNQIYYDWSGVPLIAFGVVGLAFTGAEAIGGILGSSLRRIGGPYAKYALCISAGIACAIASAWPSWPMLVVFALPHLLVAAGAILNQADLQRAITTAERATITSIDNLFANLAGMTFAAMFGVVAGRFGYHAGFGMFALILSACGAYGAIHTWLSERREAPVSPPSG